MPSGLPVSSSLILYYAFTGEEGGFTLSNFAYVATKENIKALGLALWLSLLSTALCLLLAYPLAMILANRNVNQTSFIVLIFILPMWMNFLLRTLAWQTLLEKNGVINSILRNGASGGSNRVQVQGGSWDGWRTEAQISGQNDQWDWYIGAGSSSSASGHVTRRAQLWRASLPPPI